MKPTTIHPEADAEVQEAAAYYEEQRAGLGREFRLEFQRTIEQIQRMPGISAPIDERGTRRARLRRFPYTIYFVELDDSIWIAAVAHQHRRPGYWAGREPEVH